MSAHRIHMGRPYVFLENCSFSECVAHKQVVGPFQRPSLAFNSNYPGKRSQHQCNGLESVALADAVARDDDQGPAIPDVGVVERVNLGAHDAQRSFTFVLVRDR
jgi:hypothetical protein